MRGKASDKSQNSYSLHCLLNLAHCLELKQEGQSTRCGGKSAVQQDNACSPIPQHPALRLSSGSQSPHPTIGSQSTLTLHTNIPFSMNTTSNLKNEDPQCPLPLSCFLPTLPYVLTPRKPLHHWHSCPPFSPVLQHRLLPWSWNTCWYSIPIPSCVLSLYLTSEELSIPNPFISQE